MRIIWVVYGCVHLPLCENIHHFVDCRQKVYPSEQRHRFGHGLMQLLEGFVDGSHRDVIALGAYIHVPCCESKAPWETVSQALSTMICTAKCGIFDSDMSKLPVTLYSTKGPAVQSPLS